MIGFTVGPQADLFNVAVWLGTILPGIFVLVYSLCTKYRIGTRTHLCGWRHNPAGRAIVALDLAVWVIFLPLAIGLAASDPLIILQSWYRWMLDVCLLLVTAIIAYRTVSLLVGSHRRAIADQRHEREDDPSLTR